MRQISWLTILVLLFTTTVFAREPSSEPMLKLNTEMHTAKVGSISCDAAGDQILTCSCDKTAKLWDAADGTLLKTFHVPAETGNEGRLDACALSPDGRTAAVGGWTGTHQGNISIYLFNTASGELIQRLSGLENVIYDLEFYTDGTLAAALCSGGIRIFRKSGGSYTLYKKDSAYGGQSYNLTFDRRGRLATVCYDGFIRLYDRGFNLLKKVKTKGGKQPCSVAFSPDGSKLVVGYDDSAMVEVLNGQNLKLLYRPDNSGAKSANQKINILSFGFDETLYGSGYYHKNIDGNWWIMVRRWSRMGAGTYFDFKAIKNTIMDIKLLPDGSILVAGTQPDFGRFTALGEEIFYKCGEVLDFRNKNRFEYFTINRDGSEISFKPSGLKSFTFNIKNLELKESTTLFKKFRDQYGGVTVTDWEDSYTPKINGQRTYFLKKYERCRSVDIAADGTTIFGANSSIYALDVNQKQKWQVQFQGEAWAVNIAQNGRTAVAVHSGGEIRWYRMRDGEMLLSLYVHPDGKRWILSTPDGYYDASPGADTLMGWHINKGSDAAAGFYPLAKFSSKFYRPDVIANVIKYNDVEKALVEADKKSKKKVIKVKIENMLPPVVSIISPYNGTVISDSQVRVCYRIKKPSGEPVTSVKVFVDGRPLGKRGIRIQKKAGVAEVTVDVPKRDCEISIIAENRFSASDPATVRLRWQGVEAFVVKPKLYVLAIGVSDYLDQSLTLQYGAKDARDFARVLERQNGSLYREVVVKLLTDRKADRGNILDGLDWILRETTQKDIAMVFLAGHGVNDDYGTYYYLPQNTNPDKLRRTGVPYSEIKNTVASIAGKALFFIDTCHSGNILGQRRGASDTTGIINELASAENGVVVFASSSGRQYSLEDSDWGNGAFTKAVVEGFSGKAAYKGSKITVNMMDLYISERVKELTGGRQTPTTCKPSTISDFPIAMKR